MNRGDRKFLILLWHIMVGCKQPSRRVTTKRISLKYRFKERPFDKILTPEVIDRLCKVYVGSVRNAEWFIMFVNRCKMEYAFM